MFDPNSLMGILYGADALGGLGRIPGMGQVPGMGVNEGGPMVKMPGVSAMGSPGAAAAGMAGDTLTGPQAALGLEAMKMLANKPVQQFTPPSSPGVAPRGQQIQLQTPSAAGQIDPRMYLSLAQILGGR